MGILNLAENSFYDGGKYNSIKSAILQTKKMIDEGALFVDIGVVSSKPGSNIISPKDEIKILAPYLKHLIKEFPNTFFSIDTYNSQVAKMSLDLGVSMITLFQVLTLSSWEQVMLPLQDIYWWAWIYFFSFIIICGITMLNLLIAVLVDVVINQKKL